MLKPVVWQWKGGEIFLTCGTHLHIWVKSWCQRVRSTHDQKAHAIFFEITLNFIPNQQISANHHLSAGCGLIETWTESWKYRHIIIHSRHVYSWVTWCHMKPPHLAVAATRVLLGFCSDRWLAGAIMVCDDTRRASSLAESVLHVSIRYVMLFCICWWWRNWFRSPCWPALLVLKSCQICPGFSGIL